MWHVERKQILEEALDWCHNNQIEPNSMGLIIALEQTGWLLDPIDKEKRDKQRTLAPPPKEE
jgi:hypothetical protein